MDIKVMPAGDSALVAEFGTSVDEEVNEKVHALAKKIRRENIPGFITICSGYLIPDFP